MKQEPIQYCLACYERIKESMIKKCQEDMKPYKEQLENQADKMTEEYKFKIEQFI